MIMEYCTKLLILRAARGLTQAEAAKKAGVTEKILGFVERGTVEPGPEMRERIAVALDWPGDELAEIAFAILDGEVRGMKGLRRVVLAKFADPYTAKREAIGGVGAYEQEEDDA
jgi:transcriptional regulator with XRE-family HTH domain